MMLSRSVWQHGLLIAAVVGLSWMVAVPAGAAPLLQDGLVSVWSFDELAGATTAVDTGGINSNDAVFTPGMTTTGSGFTTGGVFNNYLQFNGTSDADASMAMIDVDPSMYMTGGQMTYAGWVKLDIDPNSQYTAYVGIFDSQADDYALYTQKDTGEIRMKLVNQAGQAARPIIPTATVDPIVGHWAHVAVVYDGTQSISTKIYCNGVEAGSIWGLAGALQTGQQSSFGGAYNPATGLYGGCLHGGVDEAGLWNRALTPDEISYLYNGGLGNEIMAANPEVGGTLADLPYTTVDSATPLIRYQFEGNLNNSGGSLGASGNGSNDGSGANLSFASPSPGSDNYVKLTNGDITSGGDRIVVPYDVSSLTNGSLSFCLRSDQEYNYNSIFNCPANNGDWEMWIYSSNTATNKYKGRIDLNGIQVNPGLHQAGNGISEWNHYTITWAQDPTNSANSYMCLYLNGELVSASTSGWQPSGNEFYLGGGNGNDYATWSMDEFRLYGATLSADAALQVYKDSIAGVPEPSVLILLMGGLLALAVRRR